MSTTTALLLGVLLLAGNAFFVGAEFALISARRTQIEPRALAGSAMARTTLRAMENVSLVMAGAQLGITVTSLVVGYIAGFIAAWLFGFTPELLAEHNVVEPEFERPTAQPV